MNEPNLPVPPELGHLSTFIDSHIECLAESNSELCSLALCAAKHVFDWALETEESSIPHLRALLAALTEAVPPQTRSRCSASTQRHSPDSMQNSPKKIDIRETPLPSLFIEGMNTDQIWQQLDLRAARVCENLQVLQGKPRTKGQIWEEGENSDDESGDEGAEEMDIDDDEDPWEELSSEEEDSSSMAEGVIDLQEETSRDDEDHTPLASILDVVRGQKKLSPSRSNSQGHLDLDDGFFDLATFNTETSEPEGKEASKRKPDFVADEDSTESEVDLFDLVDDSKTGVDDGLELFYDDFFKPPRRIQSRSIRPSKVRFHERVSVKKIKPVGKGMPVTSTNDEDSEEEG